MTKQEQVGRMAFKEGKSAREISKKLNIPTGSVYRYKSDYKRKHELNDDKKGEGGIDAFPKKLLDEWDRVRLVLNPNAKKGSEDNVFMH